MEAGDEHATDAGFAHQCARILYGSRFTVPGSGFVKNQNREP
jgi:hypothetical protein